MMNANFWEYKMEYLIKKTVNKKDNNPVQAT